MDNILSAVKLQFLLVYVIDVINFLSSVEEHLEQVRTILRLLPRAEFPLKLKNCFLFQDNFDNLRHEVQWDGLGVSMRVTDAIWRLQHLTELTELMSFLGLCNVFGEFVQKFAYIATSLIHKFIRTRLSTLDE